MLLLLAKISTALHFSAPSRYFLLKCVSDQPILYFLVVDSYASHSCGVEDLEHSFQVGWYFEQSRRTNSAMKEEV